MSTTNTGNNVKAGVFVFISVVTCVVVLFALGGLWGAITGPGMTSYRMSFAVNEGVGYLSPGSIVRLGGHGWNR